ncbi:hypothetical protein [Streptomyces sp. NPDC002521]
MPHQVVSSISFYGLVGGVIRRKFDPSVLDVPYEQVQVIAASDGKRLHRWVDGSLNRVDKSPELG